ncbi:uncharacterized protein LOC121382880 [Gigantopelta aegis]|uniref:uncharacterized protein LOC121382880 n=1 Tax=Gigantopelta aegis TaxID=1735272 RepID=UPI001B88E5F6|nr:uncharacterized protein LOC121382880 [Gigantopelta aegis]
MYHPEEWQSSGRPVGRMYHPVNRSGSGCPPLDRSGRMYHPEEWQSSGKPVLLPIRDGIMLIRRTEDVDCQMSFSDSLYSPSSRLSRSLHMLHTLVKRLTKQHLYWTARMSGLAFPPVDINYRYYQPYYRRLIALKNHESYTDWPQDVKDGFDHVIKLIDARDNYVETMCSKHGKVLAGISEFTKTADWAELHKSGKTKYLLPSVMLTGHVEGLFLKFLVSMQQAKYVLDIGMFTGYSALSMAEALPADGKVFTCDRELYLAELNRKVFDSSPHGKKIEIRLGDVGDTLNALEKDGIQINFVFLDAGQEQYDTYLDLLLDKKLLAPRGTIAVDNSLWFGRSYLLDDDSMARFNKKVKDDPRVQEVLLPVRDGIMLIRRTEDVDGQV